MLYQPQAALSELYPNAEEQARFYLLIGAAGATISMYASGAAFRLSPLLWQLMLILVVVPAFQEMSKVREYLSREGSWS